MTSLSYRSSNLSLIALETMWLLVQNVFASMYKTEKPLYAVLQSLEEQIKTFSRITTQKSFKMHYSIWNPVEFQIENTIISNANTVKILVVHINGRTNIEYHKN